MICSWTEVPASQWPEWDRRLRATGASLHQYPYWIAAQTSWRLGATFLVCRSGDEEVAFLALLRYGFLRLRIGLAREGPVWLKSLDAASTSSVLSSLAEALRDRGFVAVAFAHADATLLSSLENATRSTRDPLFGFPIDERESLCVSQRSSDESTAASFAPVARRNIRRAVESGFVVERPPVGEALGRAWPVWQRAHRQPLLYGRTRRQYDTLLRRADELGALRIYLASLEGVAVQAILVALTGDRAVYVLGGLDRQALGDRPSPSCLLHFRAMRECFAAGCLEYDLGSRSGPVHRFKRKFRPVERPRMPPVNWVLDPKAYELCRHLLPRLS
jgi:hypothetical protein